MATGSAYQVERVGVFTPKAQVVDRLGPGEVGFITAAIKTVADTDVGDTITDDRNPAATALAGFKPSVPVVFWITSCSSSPGATRSGTSGTTVRTQRSLTRTAT